MQASLQTGPTIQKNRWLILATLFLVTFINYFDRQTLGCAIDPICGEFGLSLGQRGNLLAAFTTTYAIAHLFIGFITDRIRKIRTFFASLVLGWSLCTILVGLVSTYGQLMALRYALGVFEAVNFPICLMIIAKIFPIKERTLASGIFSSGGFLATLAAPKFTIFFSTHYNWRYAFIIAGMLGIVWLILWFSVFRDRYIPMEEKKDPITVKGWFRSVVTVFKTPAFWGVTALGIGIVPCLYFCTQWLPSYFTQELHQTYDDALANKLTVIYLFQDLGMWVSGFLVMFLSTKKFSIVTARKIVITLGWALMMSCLLLFVTKSPWLNVLIYAIFIFGLGFCLSNQHAFKQDVLPGQVATVSALVGFCETLFTSFVLSRIGGLVEKSGDYSVTTWILVGCSSFALIATYTLLRKKWITIK